jgi:signal transduction histidine kinase
VARGLTELRGLAQSALSEMRALIFQLRPEAVGEDGLVASIRKHAAAVATRDGFEVRVHACEDPLPLNPQAETELFRVVQEALHNSVKHAHPGHIEIRLIEPADAIRTLVVEVADDGVGFDPRVSRPGHLGLNTMRERTERLGGQFTVDSSPAGSTTIRLVLPNLLLRKPATGATNDPATGKP